MAHILLAEDDESLRKFLAAALVRAGHAVSDFGDGSEAYDCLKGFQFDLLLTDIVMPGMDGIELAKRAVGTERRAQDHVHHRLCRGGAASGLGRAQAGQGPVQALSFAGDRGGSGPDAGRGLKRDPEKWKPVFRRSRGKSISAGPGAFLWGPGRL